MLLSLGMAISLSAAVFTYFSDSAFLLYSTTVSPVGPITVFLQEYYRYGPAGVTSPVSGLFVLVILAALLIGGGVGVSVQRSMIE